LRDLEVGREAQYLSQAGESGTPDVVAADDVDGRGGVRESLWPLGHRSDADVAQFFQRERGEAAGKIAFCRRRRRRRQGCREKS
jgi:hypothetical protein